MLNDVVVLFYYSMSLPYEVLMSLRAQRVLNFVPYNRCKILPFYRFWAQKGEFPVKIL